MNRINSIAVAIKILRKKEFSHAAADLETTEKRLDSLMQFNEFLVNHKDEFAPEPDSALATAIDNIKILLKKLGR